MNLSIRVLLLGLCATSVFAADSGTITINGQVVSGTCNATLGGALNPTVNLPTVAASKLATPAATAGDTDVSLLLSACDLVGLKTVAPYFTPGANLGTGGRLKNTSATTPATNVELQILTKGTSASTHAATAINLAGVKGSQGQDTLIVTAAGGTGSFTYTIRYYATGAATAGNVTSTTAWALDYQ